MDFLVDRSYLVFPLRKDAPEISFRFFDGARCLGSYRFRYAEKAPDSVAYLDFRAFRGLQLRLECGCDPQLRQVNRPTVPLLHPEAEPEEPFSGEAFKGMPLGKPFVRADTFYVNYAWSPCPTVWLRRTLRLKKPFLALPTKSSEPMHALRVYSRGELQAEYLLRYCEDGPDFTGFLDLSRFAGAELELETDIPMRIDERTCIDTPELYRELWRPQFHFSVKSGWNNDPNGLVFLDGTYHMFYQYGPLSLHWNNMHWGHAISRDLIHWEELPVAICPHGRANIASGSAVFDERNVSGLGTEENPPVLLFYSDTADGWTQHIVWSGDGLKTLKRWEGNPALPNLCAGNRDPRAVFCEESDCWLMALYLDRDQYRIFRSGDLKHWDPLQGIHLPGDAECPDLYPILTEDGERKWVFSGAHDRYLVGSIRNGYFVPEQTEDRLSYGNLNYAAQTFSGIWPKVRRISWQQTSDWNSAASQQMGIATEMTLLTENGRSYLAAEPVAELESLCLRRQEWKELSLLPGESFRFRAETAGADISICPPDAFRGKLTISLFGILLELDYGENRLRVGAEEAPLAKRQTPGKSVRILIDKRSVEIFADDGCIYFAAEIRADFNQTDALLQTDCPLGLRHFSISFLDGIWDPPSKVK